MKPRNREVNIFNMSLLDILCGALGAFCFMMLVLFPYWKPGGANAEQMQQSNEQMQQELERLKQQLQNTPGGAQAAQQIEQLQQQMQQQQGQMNQMSQQLQEAQQQLEDQKKQIEELKWRNPITLGMEWMTAKHDMDIYTQWAVTPSAGHPGPPAPDPTKKQSAYYQGEVKTECVDGPCWEIWAIRDVGPNMELKVYYKFFSANGNPEPAVVYGWYISDGQFNRLPPAKMPHDQTAVYVGSLISDPNYKVAFKPAPEFAAAYQQMIENDKKRQNAPPQQ